MQMVQSKADDDAVESAAAESSGSPRATPACEPPPEAVSAERRHEMIAAAAFRRYQERGGTPGDPLKDWLEAEKEVAAALAQQGQTGAESAEAAEGAFLKSLSAALTECQAQIESLAAKAKDASTVLQRRYSEDLEVVTSKYNAARDKVAEVREHTDGAWAHLKGGTQAAVDEMKIAIRELASLFNK